MSATTCRGRRKDGGACRSTAVREDGYCALHGASSRFDPAELGRRGGIRSGEARRELAKNARQRLREEVEHEHELIWQGYREALEATHADGKPDYRTRVMARDALLAQAYGKPVQPTEERGAPSVLVIHRPARSWQAEADEIEVDPPPLPLRGDGASTHAPVEFVC